MGVSLKLGFLDIDAKWEANPTQRRAAWSLYVELATRVSTEPLAVDHGLLREALTSLYSLFKTTREILREAGPDIGISKQSVGGIALAVLNRRVRPFLAKWHPLLGYWEAGRGPAVSPFEHEQAWKGAQGLREELKILQRDLQEYTGELAKIAGVRE